MLLRSSNFNVSSEIQGNFSLFSFSLIFYWFFVNFTPCTPIPLISYTPHTHALPLQSLLVEFVVCHSVSCHLAFGLHTLSFLTNVHCSDSLAWYGGSGLDFGNWKHSPGDPLLPTRPHLPSLPSHSPMTKHLNLIYGVILKISLYSRTDTLMGQYDLGSSSLEVFSSSHCRLCQLIKIARTSFVIETICKTKYAIH